MTSYARPRVRDIPNSTGTRTAALDALITDAAKAYGATSNYDSKDILTTDQQTLRNRTNYAATPAQFGATTGIDVTDPVRLPHTGEHYVWLPPFTAANYLLAAANVDHTGSGEWAYEGIMPSSGGTNFDTLIGDRAGQVAEGQIRLGTSPDVFQFFWYESTVAVVVNTGVHGISPGDRFAVRAVRDNTGGTAGVWLVEIYLSINGGAESLLYSEEGLVAAAPTANSQSVRIGGGGGANEGLGGEVFSASVTMDGDSANSISFSSADINDDGTINGWTAVRPATGLKTAVVTRPVVLPDGTDDYVQQPAGDTPTFTKTTGEHTQVLAFRCWSDQDFARLWSAESAPNVGISLQLDAANVYAIAGDGAATRTQGPRPFTLGNLVVVAVRVDDGIMHLWVNESGLSAGIDLGTLAGSLSFSAPRIGTGSGLPIEAEIFACLTYKDQALTETELDAIAAELIAGAYA